MEPVAEREVAGRVATDVEAVGFVPAALVAVRGSEQQQTLAAGGKGGAVQLDVAGQEPGEGLGRRVEAQRLFDGRGDEGRVGEQLGPLVGKRVEPEDRVAEQLRRGLVARDQQQEAEAEHLGRRQRAVTLLRRDERADEVVARRARGGRRSHR